jgi:D123
MEFRCFIRNRKLLCISQRENTFYPYLATLRPEIHRLATELFSHLLELESRSWVFDMYIPRTRLRAHLIDVNPFAPRTDPGLFEWSEILSMTGEDIVVRLAQEEGIRGMEFTAQRVPREVVEVSQGRGVVEFAVEWEEMLRRGVWQDKDESDTE